MKVFFRNHLQLLGIFVEKEILKFWFFRHLLKYILCNFPYHFFQQKKSLIFGQNRHLECISSIPRPNPKTNFMFMKFFPLGYFFNQDVIAASRPWILGCDSSISFKSWVDKLSGCKSCNTSAVARYPDCTAPEKKCTGSKQTEVHLLIRS